MAEIKKRSGLLVRSADIVAVSEPKMALCLPKHRRLSLLGAVRALHGANTTRGFEGLYSTLGTVDYPRRLCLGTRVCVPIVYELGR